MSAKDRLEQYIKKDEIYRNYKQGKLMNCSDFDKFCIQHCKDIEELIEENHELKDKISNMQESYETDAEAKFYDYVDKYNSKKLLTANDYVELNKNNEILMIYNQTLLKENQELKKQLEERSKDYCNASNIKHNYAKKLVIIQNQQQEFIKYLEDEINRLKNNHEHLVVDMFGSYDLNDIELKLLKEILQKHKEIIGDDK